MDRRPERCGDFPGRRTVLWRPFTSFEHRGRIHPARPSRNQGQANIASCGGTRPNSNWTLGSRDTAPAAPARAEIELASMHARILGSGAADVVLAVKPVAAVV